MHTPPSATHRRDGLARRAQRLFVDPQWKSYVLAWLKIASMFLTHRHPVVSATARSDASGAGPEIRADMQDRKHGLFSPVLQAAVFDYTRGISDNHLPRGN